MEIFSILLALGSFLGLIWISLETSASDRGTRLTVGIWSSAGALIGARIAYVSVNWAYFQDHLVEIIQVWLGGLSWPGALAGGWLVFILAAWIMGIPLGYLADDFLPLLASPAVATWLGCWLSGCAYGPVASWGLPAKNEWGIWEQRFPVQLTAALTTVILFWGLERWRHYWDLIPGLAASLGVGGLSLLLLGASALRADPYPLYNGIRLETWAALIFLGISIISGALAVIQNQR